MMTACQRICYVFLVRASLRAHFWEASPYGLLGAVWEFFLPPRRRHAWASRGPALCRQAWARGRAVAPPLRLVEEVHGWKMALPGSRCVGQSPPPRENKLHPQLKHGVVVVVVRGRR